MRWADRHWPRIRSLANPGEAAKNEQESKQAKADQPYSAAPARLTGDLVRSLTSPDRLEASLAPSTGFGVIATMICSRAILMMLTAS
eukprot:6971396-Alexandrium_andersonii.AAC.1